MAQWKKVVVSGSSLAQLDNSTTQYITSADVTQIGTTATTALRGDSTASIAANASGVATNASAIAGLNDLALGTTATTALRGDTTASIAANASSISSNTSNISTNTSNISTNTSAIAGLNDLALGTTATTALRGDTTASIAANASAIAGLNDLALGTTATTALRGDTTASIAANASSISSNTSNISTNTSNISLKANIASPAFTGNATAVNLGVSGNLSVAGTASFEHSENLLVRDSIILLGSGSAAASKDGGTVVYQSGDDGSMIGNFLGYQANAGEAGAGGRYGVAAGIEPDASAVTLAEFLSTVKVAASSPTGDGSAGADKPAFGGTSGFGSLWVNSSTNEAYIYV